MLSKRQEFATRLIFLTFKRILQYIRTSQEIIKTFRTICLLLKKTLMIIFIKK